MLCCLFRTPTVLAYLSLPPRHSARDAGAVTINYGLFLENVINFIINAIFLYIAIKKCECGVQYHSSTDWSYTHALGLFSLYAVFEVVFERNVNVKKQCPFCKEFIKGAATVCKECGSKLS